MLRLILGLALLSPGCSRETPPSDSPTALSRQVTKGNKGKRKRAANTAEASLTDEQQELVRQLGSRGRIEQLLQVPCGVLQHVRVPTARGSLRERGHEGRLVLGAKRGAVHAPAAAATPPAAAPSLPPCFVPQFTYKSLSTIQNFTILTE